MSTAILSLSQALGHLKNYSHLSPRAVDELNQWRLSPEVALAGIEEIQLHFTLLHLYQQLFPQEYAVSNKSSRYQSGEHSPKEIEFFSWIDDRLFPCPYYDAYDELMVQIPIHPITPNWWEVWVGDLDLLWVERVLLGFCGQWNEFYQSLSATHQQHISSHLLAVSDIDVDLLQQHCQQEPPPICYFHPCLDLLSYDTGNVFLDNTVLEYIEGLEWSLNNIEKLAQDYQAAQQRLHHMHELNQWLEEDIPSHINHLVRLWSRCT
jgi:hypothetical protein